jgi:hypothetical protein
MMCAPMSPDSMTRRSSGMLRAALGLVSLIGAAATATPAGAQGTLSGLGYGYPVGTQSVRVSGTAGAFGEFDAVSAINPAAIGGLSRTVLSAQAEPEYRKLTLGSASERTTVQRIPLLTVALPVWRQFAMALSAGSLLDRTSTTITTGTAMLDGQPVPTRDKLDMRGAIGDLRAAIGWAYGDRVRLGVAGHIMTGEHVGARERTFADTLRFGGVSDTSRATYFGTAVSLGGELRLFRGLTAHGSYRLGNDFDARIRDTTRASGQVPDRLGAALRYDGIAGATFAVGMEQTKWSDMATMSSSRINALDTRNVFAGAELLGPRMRGMPVMVRAGYARNELPFTTASGAQVKETRASVGLGLPVAREAASMDFSLQRASRSASGIEAKESAWLFGFGIQIRP